MKINLIILLPILMLSCNNENIIDGVEQVRTITFGFESSLDNWVNLGGSGDRNFDDDIRITSEVKLEGDYSCKFTVSPESIVSNGNRAELIFDQYAVENDETWYSYSFYIPTDYKDVPLKDNTGLVNWQIIGQWHQQPVFADGEDWNSYTGGGENDSPPIAIYYNYLSTTDTNYQNLLNNSTLNSIHGFNQNWNEVSTISIVYGSKSIAICEITKGEWVSLKFSIKWSENTDGFIQAWKNGNEFTNGKIYGANMLNRASHYFKFGLYRNPSIPHTNCLYFDDIKIWEN